MIGQSLTHPFESCVIRRRNAQHIALSGPRRGCRRVRRLLKDNVRVGAANAESADAGGAEP